MSITSLIVPAVLGVPTKLTQHNKSIVVFGQNQEEENLRASVALRDTHINEYFRKNPLPIYTFLHLHTACSDCRTRTSQKRNVKKNGINPQKLA